MNKFTSQTLFIESGLDSNIPTAFLAPSLTPIVNGDFSTNPGVRIYSYQTGKPSLLDYDQVYRSLSNIVECYCSLSFNIAVFFCLLHNFTYFGTLMHTST